MAKRAISEELVIGDLVTKRPRPDLLNGLDSSLVGSPLRDDGKRRVSLANRQLNNNRKSLAVYDNDTTINESRRESSDPHQIHDSQEFTVNLNSLHEINSKFFNPNKAFNYNFINIINSFIDRGKLDFKIIAMSLDAGTRVYVSKVELVMNNTQKISSSLSMATEDQKGDDDEGLLDDSFGRQNVEKRKKRKQRKNINTIVPNIDTINSKLETNIEIDPLFHHLSAAFDVGNVNSLLMANLITDPSGATLLDSAASPDFTSISTCESTTINHPFPKPELIFTPTAHICKSYHSFEFLRRDTDMSINLTSKTPNETEMPNFDFDINADVEDVSEPGDFDFGDGSLDEYNVDNIGPASNVDENRNGNRSDPLNETSDSILKIFPDTENENNQFLNRNFLRRAFKGVHRYRHLRTSYAHTTTPRKTRSRPCHQEIELTLDNLSDDLFTSSDNINFSVQTINKWVQNAPGKKVEECTDFDRNQLLTCFTRPEFYSMVRKNDEVTHHSTDGPVEDNHSVDDYADDGVRHDDDFGPNFNSHMFDVDAPTDKQGDDEPEHIDALDIDYAKVSKKIDIKKVKSGMWDIIKKDQTTQVESQNPDEPSQTDSQKALTFFDLRQNLPNLLSNNLNENLSTPISFVALLHLCNEKNLLLKPQEVLSDFIIEAPKT